MGDTLLTC